MHTIERAVELVQAKHISLTAADLTRKLEAGELQGEQRNGQWFVDEASLNALLNPPPTWFGVWKRRLGGLAAFTAALALFATQAQTILDFTCDRWTLWCKSTPEVAVLKTSIALRLNTCPLGFEIPAEALERVRQGNNLIDFTEVGIREHWKPIGTRPIIVENQAGNYTGAQVVTPAYMNFRVQRLGDYPDVPNALAAAECGGGGMESLYFDTVPLHKSKDTYIFTSKFMPESTQQNYSTFRIEPNEPLYFQSTFQCEEPGIYSLIATVDYRQGADSNISESQSVEIYCPGEIRNYDLSSALPGSSIPYIQVLRNGYYDFK